MTVIVWNMEKIRQKNASSEALVSVLKDHEHVIDCIKWAPYEACVTIEKGINKNNNSNGEFPQKNGNVEESDQQPEEEEKTAPLTA